MKKDVEKLKLLLNHWIEHTREHTAEYRKWFEKIRGEIPEDAVKKFEEAIKLTEKSGDLLESALEQIKNESL
ncbi:MAG TPA: hypothetical protein ENL39_05110 [Candidatus Aerophobetes bacterium]|uniref:DUF8180 domain-containing protein n=1 Tax=Aerophobetes bacterium TaxID=2030807 RepID=A0A7V5HZM5_UNCAE|nr:hypothetical protein [Candidatus Aerophobetes bacterium]